MRNEMKKMSVLLLTMGLVLTLPASLSQAAESTNPYGSTTIDPAAPNEVIFTVSKGKRKSTFTYNQLIKLKSQTISIYEPFLKKRQTFTVIPIQQFFSLAGISGSDKVETRALNDYAYINTASKFIKAGALVAIKRGGKEIPYDQGGPIRLIYSDKSSWSKELDAWNWSLDSIIVK